MSMANSRKTEENGINNDRNCEEVHMDLDETQEVHG